MASCRSCERYDVNCRDCFNDGYCSYHEKHVDADSRECSRYYNEDDRREEEDEKESDSGGCFLTTITCLILGEPDDGPTLTTLRRFRENVLRKETHYSSILEEYDVLGPRISDRLWNDPDRERVAAELMAEHLTPVLEAVNSGLNETAVERYCVMVRLLQKRYGL